jgi:translation initiation factor IF-2
MTRRLVKIAKELNVGTTTIVDYLNDSGYSIENKPNAKITEEMYGVLLKEFQKSIAIKEEASKLVIGTRPTTGKSESSTPSSTTPSPFSPRKEKEEVEKPKKEAPEQKEEETTPKVKLENKVKVVGKIDLGSKLRSKAAQKSQKAKKEELPEQKPTQVEPPKKEEAPVAEKQEKVTPPKEEAPKIEKAEAKEPTSTEKETKQDKKKATASPKDPSLNKSDQQSELKEENATLEKSPKTAETPTAEKKKPSKGKVKKPKTLSAEEREVTTTDEAGDDVVRIEAPELRGLKIQGKINIDKFKRSSKKKKDAKDDKKKPKDDRQKRPKDASGDSKPGKSGSQRSDKSSKDDSGQDRRKRRRTRKKITVDKSSSRPSRGRNQRGNSSGRKSKDEVQEISQKEIEEKIKATMARISGKGKKKRQRLQRDKRERMREKEAQKEQETQTGKLQVTEFISVQELANLMDVPVTDVIMTCMNLGVIVSINQRLDAEIIELVAEEFNHEVEFISAEEEVEEEEEIIDDPEDLKPRAPIVTVMGHVDHGKTSLLDYIREANVVGGEAGGITQHIGAYEVRVGENKKKITFLDTPGHEAFTAMRARGAKVTDIAIIIIAADDNIMPQTKEAISHAQAAGVPIVFAINKIDKPDASPERIKQELASMNLLVEEWGGSYQSQDISAKTGLNIDQLLEKVLLEAEMLELQANPDRKAIGTVVEASLDKGRGYVTKMLVQTGTLHIGDSVVAGEHSGKVRAMLNERGKRVKEAGPSTPVLVLGLDGAPQAGERFKEVDTDQEARQIASRRAQIAREQANRATKRISLDEIGRRLALGNFKELNLIVKGDVDGSVEALSDSLIKLSIESIQVNVIHKAVGQIIESDVLLASASDAIIIGFQVRPSMGARKLAEREGVEIKTYSIIYEAIEQIKMAMEGMLEPDKEERIVSQVEVREVYKISKVGTVAGCYVQEGRMTRNTHVRLIRNGIVIYPTKEGVHGELGSLKRFKDDVKEVKTGLECGLTIKNFNDLKAGDIVEGYEIIEVKQTL